MGKEVNITRSKSRKFSGSSVPVGSRTGKILLSSGEVQKILSAVRESSSGKTVRVDISKPTADRISALKS